MVPSVGYLQADAGRGARLFHRRPRLLGANPLRRYLESQHGPQGLHGHARHIARCAVPVQGAAAGGLPVPNSTNPIDCVRAAIEMREWINDFNRRLQKEGKPLFEIRIGLHTGPIVAGVVGTKKFAYDIWGDVVNTASRMESNSEPGKINISGETYNLIKEKFSCTYRGKIKAKNKGEIDITQINQLKD